MFALDALKASIDFDSLSPDQQLEIGSRVINETTAAIQEHVKQILAKIPVDANGRI